MNNKVNLKHVLPVLLAFFVMSFVDLVGISVDRITVDMNLSATMAQLIPSAALLWFLVLSVPLGVLQSKIGKKRMLNIGILMTTLGLLVPFFFYTFSMVLIGFALMGIGNTILQVSANPLLVHVVPGNRATSFLSFSQFIKSVGSMLGAPLAALLAARFGDWKLLFLVFGIISIISVLWLGSVKIHETTEAESKSSLSSAFKLLGNTYIFLMVMSIFIVVGIDVGFNSHSGQYLMKVIGMEQVAAESGRSVYFFGKMLGTFGGAILLTRIAARKFYLWSAILGILAFLAILLVRSPAYAWIILFIIGLAVANVFPIVIAISVEKYPERSSEITGLLMMAICGGAVIPLLMGWITDISSYQYGMLVLLACMIFLFFVALYALRVERKNKYEE